MELPYERRSLYCNDEREALLTIWPPGVESPIHDHGNSRGWGEVLEGEIEEERFVRGIGPVCTVYRAGERFKETPDTIHIIRNPSPTCRAVVLHVNTPPLTLQAMRRFSREDTTAWT